MPFTYATLWSLAYGAHSADRQVGAESSIVASTDARRIDASHAGSFRKCLNNNNNNNNNHHHLPVSFAVPATDGLRDPVSRRQYHHKLSTASLF